MTFYAWTISVPGRQVMKEVTTLAELQDVLRVLALPGAEVFMQVDHSLPDHGGYTNDEGTMDEWSLKWTKVDGETEVID
jgi:hypothetical protein